MTSFENGKIGEQFTPHANRAFDASKLSPSEVETLTEVVSKLKKYNTNDIIKLSHEEEAWEKNFSSGKRLISYIDAFKLVNI